MAPTLSRFARLTFTLLVVVVAQAACGGATPAATPVPTPSPRPTVPPDSTAPWQLVFSDEFDGAGLPDASKWAYEEGLIRNNEAQYYTVNRLENARVADGLLVIEARKEDYSTGHYTSASLETRNKAQFRYAKIEVRAKLPTGRGTWPAIWMLGVNYPSEGWPRCGEIDIMENVGFDPTRIVFSVHTRTYNHAAGTAKSTSVTTTNPWEDFHVYGIEWRASRIDFFLDGTKVFTFNNEMTGPYEWPFDAEQYLKLNLAIGGTWGGQQGIDDTIFPQRFYIDYVRVYHQQ